jgi:CheY-like chemotaxis protein
MEPFFSTKGNCGTGMGLATVYGAVRRHNGAVHIDSAIGTGTTVSLWLPVEDAHELTKTRKRDPNLDTTVLSGLHVLVVEDDPRVREVLLAFLTGEGHIVDVAASGKEGLFKFKRGGFGLVITDRSMSGGGGDQLAAAVKQVSPSVPVIMLTGFSEFMKAGGERPPGVDVLVGKPISMAELRQAVGEAMGRNG